MTMRRFMELFPDEDACLDYLKQRFYPDGSECPKCERVTRFHRIRGRKAYSCQHCGHQVYPTAGTIFHKSSTDLSKWFWAVYLLSSTRCGISAVQLQGEIDVTYKTAWRMLKEIRTMLGYDEERDRRLYGRVEMDETLIGGRPRVGDIPNGMRGVPAWIAANKTTVVAVVERGGQVRTQVVPDRTSDTLRGVAAAHVDSSATLYTDEFRLYKRVGADFAEHHQIKHKDKVYVSGHVHTQTVEGFFGLVKNAISGTHHWVSPQHLQKYLDEFAFRYNHRDSDVPLFWHILDRVKKNGRLALA